MKNHEVFASLPRRTQYDFSNQLQVGTIGEDILDAYFQRQFVITPATDAEQRRGIDRHFTDRLTGVAFTVEYKTDRACARTGNVFLETVSMDTYGRPGWALTSQADRLFYYLPHQRTVLDIPFPELRRLLAVWQPLYRERPVPNKGYTTWGLPIPLTTFVPHTQQWRLPN